jgi:hypothetical protein
VRPFGGVKVHWTFTCFRLTSRFCGRGGVGDTATLLLAANPPYIKINKKAGNAGLFV